MEQAESQNEIQTLNAPKSRSFGPLIFLLVLILFLGLIGGFLYLGGGVSFLMRAREVSRCENKGKCSANPQITLTQPQQVQGEEGLEENSLMTQKVVYIGFLGGKYWTFSLDGPIKKFKQVPSTTFGIALAVDEKDLGRRDIASKLESGLLQRVEPSTFEDNNKILLIEADARHLTGEEFRAIVKSGSLLTALYEPASKELTGLILMDLGR